MRSCLENIVPRNFALLTQAEEVTSFVEESQRRVECLDLTGREDEDLVVSDDCLDPVSDTEEGLVFELGLDRLLYTSISFQVDRSSRLAGNMQIRLACGGWQSRD